MRAVEPDEIITPGQERRAPPKVDPWARFAARFLDYALFFQLLLFFRGLLIQEPLIPFEYALWIPFEALCLYFFKTTHGKWFMKIRLVGFIDFRKGLVRSALVWFRGLGLGIPIINVLCMMAAYQKLLLFRKTSWDREEQLEVVQGPFPKWRFYAAVSIAAIGLFNYYSEKRAAASELHVQ